MASALSLRSGAMAASATAATILQTATLNAEQLVALAAKLAEARAATEHASAAAQSAWWAAGIAVTAAAAAVVALAMFAAG